MIERRLADRRRENLKSLFVVLFVQVSFEHSFEGIGTLNVTNFRRERIPLLWSTVRECFGQKF